MIFWRHRIGGRRPAVEGRHGRPDVERVSRGLPPHLTAYRRRGRHRKTELRLQQDFTDYSGLADILPQVNTVLWGLGTSSLNVDDTTYSRIHVDFPVAFGEARGWPPGQKPMSFHYVTGMGTDANGDSHWAGKKAGRNLKSPPWRRETGLRTFGYRSAFIRPRQARASPAHYLPGPAHTRQAGDQFRGPGRGDVRDQRSHRRAAQRQPSSTMPTVSPTHMPMPPANADPAAANPAACRRPGKRYRKAAG